MSNKDLTPVKLRGVLAKKFGSGIRYLDVSSPQEAVAALCATVPGFEEHRNLRVKILVKDAPVALDDVGQTTGRHEIRIVPVVHGAKDGTLEFVLGAVLVVVGAYLTVQSDGAASPWAAPLMKLGAALMAGGIAQMLMTPPSQDTGSQSKNSFLFNNAANTIGQGGAVPVLYGQMVIVPPLISMGLDTEAYTDVAQSYPAMPYDGLGTWVGNGDTTAWGGSLAAI